MQKREQSNLFLTLDGLVSLDHPYRKLDRLLPFNELSLTYQGLYSPKGRKEKGFEFGWRALIFNLWKISVIERWNAIFGSILRANGFVT